jgi:hypothetical protein
MNIRRLLAVASAAFFVASSALAQSSGSVTSHAFAVGKGPGMTGFSSVLCGLAQIPVGQTAADPICQTLTGDVTISGAGATTIGPVTGTGSFVKNTSPSFATTINTPVISPLADSTTSLRINDFAQTHSILTLDSTNFRIGINKNPGAFDLDVNGPVKLNSTLSVTGHPTLEGVTSTGATGTGNLVFGTSPSIAGGALSGTFTGTPTFSGANFLTLGNLVQGAAYSFLGNSSSGTANYAPFTIGSLPLKASPISADTVIIADSAASGALSRTTAGALSTVGNVSSVNTLTGAVTLLTEPQGRLTLQANVPVMSSTQANIGTLRYDCYNGANVPYYTGSLDAMDTIASCEVSDAMVSAASAGQVVAGQVYDVWWVHSGANRICLAMSASSGGGGGWASDTGGSITARGTGYSQLDRVTRPYITNKNALTNCFNGATNYGSVSANQATYLGTIFATANGQSSFIFGGSASGGTAALFGVWNNYNRVSVTTNVTDSGTSYTYTSGTVRQARASSGNQVQFVLGAAEDGVIGSYINRVNTVATATATTTYGCGFDSTTTYSGQGALISAPTAATFIGASGVPCSWTPSVGFHTLSANESGDGTNANTINPGGLAQLSATLRM